MATGQELPLLTGQKLEKSFASRLLFRDLSFGIPAKARIGLVGANGAGKSTLLKILCGRMRPDSGEVVTTRGLRVALLEQDANFPPDQTVREALSKGAEDSGLDPYEPQVLRKIDQTLSLLELSSSEDRVVSKLSGGWRRRVQIGTVLVTEPDLVLLDEPTNHLDTESILWLEDFLLNSELTFVLVSHDRLFLSRTVDRIYELDHRHPNGILTVEDGFSTYLERKAELMAGLGEREKRLANRLRRETEWLRRGAKARQTKQRARIEGADELAQEVSRLKTLNRKNRLSIGFSETDQAPEKLIDARNIARRRPTTDEGFASDEFLFRELDMIVTSRSRIGLLGPNGCGKTTLIKTLLGIEKPDEGKVVRAENLQAVHFEQGRDSIDSQLSLAKNLAREGDSVIYQGRPVNVKGYLSKFQFRSEQVDLPAGRLSGGERARLRIAQTLLQPASLLILDEPTNDLDFDTLETLEEALDEYKGAVLIVSHDRTFLDNVTDEIWSFATPDSPKLTRYASYLQWELARATWPSAGPNGKKTSLQAAPTAPVQKAKISFKEKFEFEQMESVIAKSEAELAELELKAATVAMKDQSAHYAAIAAAQSAIEKLYSRWAELEAKIKST